MRFPDVSDEQCHTRDVCTCRDRVRSRLGRLPLEDQQNHGGLSCIRREGSFLPNGVSILIFLFSEVESLIIFFNAL